MTNSANDPAFPWEQSPGNQNNLGLTKREWFAGQALIGLLASTAGSNAYWTAPFDPQAMIVREAWKLADAMLKTQQEP